MTNLEMPTNALVVIIICVIFLLVLFFMLSDYTKERSCIQMGGACMQFDECQGTTTAFKCSVQAGQNSQVVCCMGQPI